MKPFNWTCPFCGQATTITEPNYSKDITVIDTTNSKFSQNMPQQNRYDYIGVEVAAIACPNPICKELTLEASLVKTHRMSGCWIASKQLHSWPLLPRSCAKPQPDYIPEAIRQDYEEASLILNHSPKASATLSRRCLQGIVRDFWRIPDNKRGKLGAEISFIKHKLADDTWDAIEAIRNTGDVGAHMEKDVNFIVDVEPDEAELLIQLIETLLEDWYIERYHRQQRSAKARALVEKKKQERVDAKKASKEAKTTTLPLDKDDGPSSI